jgi:SAM-dependent methyltransferase
MPEAFVDRHGVSHPLDPRHRDRLKPDWRSMLDPEAAARPPTDEALAGRVTRAERIVDEALALVESASGGSLEGPILEVGCYDGSVAFRLAAVTGARVVASDMARYYVVQRPGEPDDEQVADQQVALATLRERMRQASGAAPGAVEFVEDDITVSVLEDGSCGSIVSFEVLEHLADPAAAFAAMHRILRPGGVGYHLYNPYLSINGGHSLGTLDFPWGHARLDPGDLERYVHEIRPDAATQTLRFLRESVNRMTLADLRTAIEAGGLELLACVPWADRGLAPQLAGGVLAAVRETYPSATTEDLLATFVAVVVRRPA